MSEQEIIAKLEELHSKYKQDADLERMPGMAMLVGTRAKQKLDDEYGITYMKKRLELEDKLDLKNDSIQKKTQ